MYCCVKLSVDACSVLLRDSYNPPGVRVISKVASSDLEGSEGSNYPPAGCMEIVSSWGMVAGLDFL